MSDSEKPKNCVFTFKRSRGRGGRGQGQRKRNNSDSSSSSEDETAVVKQSKERKVNPMVQKSHLFKKHRGKGEGDSGDEEQNPAGKGQGSTGVSYETSGAAIRNEMKENTFATRDFDTEQEKDQRSITERADEVQKATEGLEDDKIYRGMNNYAQYIEKREALQGKRLATKGPIRAPTNIRSTVRWDYEPNICKDYKETGMCGFGDSCKFMHDRGDYKMGWQQDIEWDEAQKRKADGEEGEDSSGDEKYVISDGDDDLPTKCPFCKKVFTTPVSTRCKHYFCEKCAIEHYRKSLRCYECGKQTGGVFNPAKELMERMRKREAAGKTYSSSDDEKLPDESEPVIAVTHPPLLHLHRSSSSSPSYVLIFLHYIASSSPSAFHPPQVTVAIPEDDPDYYSKVHDPYEDDHAAHASY